MRVLYPHEKEGDEKSVPFPISRYARKSRLHNGVASFNSLNSGKITITQSVSSSSFGLQSPASIPIEDEEPEISDSRSLRSRSTDCDLHSTHPLQQKLEEL